MSELRTGNRVWKVGSRWSHDGNAGSCILDLFRRHRVVFVGHDHDRFEMMREGDLIAISSGKRVVALGRAMGNPVPFAQLGDLHGHVDWSSFDTDGIGLACRISFQDLTADEFVNYCIGAFHEVHDRAEQFRELYRSYQESRERDEFSIKARSCTVVDNPTSPDDVLLAPSACFRIPIFQRAYSWGDREIRRLLSDLLNGYAGRLGKAEREPMFLGTIQVSDPTVLDDSFTRRYDIIDGQQRMTTLALLTRALQLRSPRADDEPVSWITTEIGGGIQQGYLERALTDPSPQDSAVPLNLYLDNLKLILTYLDDDEALETEEEFTAFRNYVTSRVFFVVIETRAGLSKTLQIFDSINTSGMDLNGGDVFKIRYFEYLCSHERCEESIFDEISDLYTMIIQANKELGKEALWMEGILGCAKWIVCERLDLPFQVRELTGTTFFDRLFDTVLRIQVWDGFVFEKCAKVTLPLSLFRELISAAVQWHQEKSKLASEAAAMDVFLSWSRYGNYHDPLVILLFWRFHSEAVTRDETLIAFGKLLLIYSILSRKKTHHGRGVVHTVLGRICDGATSEVELLTLIRKTSRENSESVRQELNEGWLAGNTKGKNLVCRLIAFLDEMERKPSPTAEALCDLLFWKQEIDIEHIEAANHKDGTKRTEIQEEWGQDLHGLGNLIVLERHLNRSISNELYQSHKREHFLKSRFETVKKFAESHPSWTLQDARDRKAGLSEKVTRYLCGELPLTP